MAGATNDRVSRALELLSQGLGPFVERVCEERFGDEWIPAVAGQTAFSRNDVQFQLRTMISNWNDVFAPEFARGVRAFVFEARDVRNRWAHQDDFTLDEADRALDTIQRLLAAVDSPDLAAEVRRMRDGLLQPAPSQLTTPGGTAAPVRRRIPPGERDVLVVAANWGYPMYLKYSGYFCPPNRAFRDVDRLGFYADGAIQPQIPEILLRVDGETLSRERAARLEQAEGEAQRALGRMIGRLIADDVYPEGRKTQLFVLTAPNDPRTLVLPQPVENTTVDKNGRRTAFAMGTRFTSSVALKTGPRTTDELRAAGG